MRHFQPTAGIVLRFTRGRCRALPFALASLSCLPCPSFSSRSLNPARGKLASESSILLIELAVVTVCAYIQVDFTLGYGLLFAGCMVVIFCGLTCVIFFLAGFHYVSYNIVNRHHRRHRLRCSVSTVVTMTSKVNGKTEILTPCRSETPENIEAKLGVNDYVMDLYNTANFLWKSVHRGQLPILLKYYLGPTCN